MTRQEFEKLNVTPPDAAELDTANFAYEFIYQLQSYGNWEWALIKKGGAVERKANGHWNGHPQTGDIRYCIFLYDDDSQQWVQQVLFRY